LKGRPSSGRAPSGADAGGLRFVRVADFARGGQTGAAVDGKQVVVDNFSFTPARAAFPDDGHAEPRRYSAQRVSLERKIKSPVLDTDEVFSHTFDVAYHRYYRSIHPRMTGQVVVR
jgi:hypothetical protein